jgi:integrase
MINTPSWPANAIEKACGTCDFEHCSRTAYTFAFRKGELLNLRVRPVDLASRVIQLDVGTTKNA